MDVEPLVQLDDVSFVGEELHRPESVLCTADGRVVVSDWRGGVTLLHPDGRRSTVLASGGGWLRPNGIALEPDGSFLLAHLGDDAGGVFRLRPDGSWQDLAVEVDGTPLPPTNFVHLDAAGRTWITVSTRRRPRSAAYRADVADGFVVCVDRQGARIVADGLGYTNEAHVDPSGTYLYVNETFARRLSRFPLTDRGLGPRQTVVEFGAGVFPDGLAFDELGGVWITSIVSNRVIRVGTDGEMSLVLEDADIAHLDAVERSFADGGLDRDELNAVVSQRLHNISSLAFGGPDRRTVYLGCLGGDSLATFRSPVAGARPSHWR